ncbi:MAG: GNAT family N-acetyltransferase [Verrucomicrobiota bacterium]
MIHISRASSNHLEDVAYLFDLYRQFYSQTPDIEGARHFLQKRFKNEDSVIFIARNLQQAPLGFIQLYPGLSSVSMGSIFTLNDLFVISPARRLGVAGQLMEAATRYAQEVGGIRLTLSTAVSNVNAQKLYERKGWTKDNYFYTYHFSVKK